jgi:hypothetical protein
MAKSTENRWGAGTKDGDRWKGNRWEEDGESGERSPDQQAPWPEELNTAKDATYLSISEKSIILEYNKIRHDPKKYAELVLKPLMNIYKGNSITIAGKWVRKTVEGIKGLERCIGTLENNAKYAPMSLVYPFEGFSEIARLHALDQSKNGGIGHIGSDGRDEGKRILAITEPIPLEDYKTKENINYGPWQNLSKWVLFDLLVDDGDSMRPHLFNILMIGANQVGVSIKSHPVHGMVSVHEIGFGMQIIGITIHFPKISA